MARYAVFLADTGQRDRAQDLIRDMDKRVTKISPHFRKEARTWRDFAAKTLEPTT